MFNSERLIYRELVESDWELFYELYSNQQVMQYAYLDKFASIEEGKTSFLQVLSMQNDDNKGTQYAAIDKGTNIPIGIVDYYVILSHEKGGIYEIGYFIKPEFWGRGYGCEMGQAMIDYLFQTTRIHKIMASCNANNLNSENIMRKLGMTKESISPKSRFKNGQWEDEIRYFLLREDWNLQKGK